MVRLKYSWHSESETNSKYFFGFVKVKYSNKTFKRLINETNEIFRDQSKILKEQHRYYRKLYTANPEIVFKYTNKTDINISDAKKGKLNRLIELNKISKALADLKSNSSLGLDGIRAAFYRVFWNRIKHYIFNAITYAIDTAEKFHYTARQGILALIPKKIKSPEKIQNWMSLTLMTIDHELLAKTLANRIKPTLQTIISLDQTGFMKGRKIGINIRCLIDLLHYVENEQIPCLLVLLDFYKCFDSIEFQAIEGALRYLNYVSRVIYQGHVF